MQVNRNILFVAVAILAAVSLTAILREGAWGMKTPFTASFWTWQYFIDLVIALGLVMVWMWRDSRSRGKNPVPWILATCVAGSFSPLLYLILRHRDSGETPLQPDSQ